MTCKVLRKKKSTRKERRLEIVKDCLARLRYRKIETGYYCSGEVENNLPFNDQLQKHVKTLEKKCKVCALGSLFLSSVDKYNSLETNDLCIRQTYDKRYEIDATFETMLGNLRKYFSDFQLMLIESAFELSNKYYNYPYVARTDIYTAGQKAVVFGEKYDDPKKRMRAILNNIIKNDGLFKV